LRHSVLCRYSHMLCRMLSHALSHTHTHIHTHTHTAKQQTWLAEAKHDRYVHLPQLSTYHTYTHTDAHTRAHTQSFPCSLRYGNNKKKHKCKLAENKSH